VDGRVVDVSGQEDDEYGGADIDAVMVDIDT
jgi:hypothetical protein